MAEKNGGDIGAVYQAVQSLAGEVRSGFSKVDARLTTVDTRLTKLESGQDDLRHGLDELRHTVTEYHSSVVGHGILISDLEARIRRLERHVGLPPKS
jgi:signal transduction histidine kinase